MSLAPSRNLGLRGVVGVWLAGGEAARLFAFLLAGGAFSLQLSGLDPHAPVGADSASGQSEIALSLALMVLILSGASGWRRVLPLMKANAPLLALPVLAILSALWAPEPLVALRRGLAFALTLLAAVAVVARSPGAAALRFLIRAVAAAMALSIAYVALAPALRNAPADRWGAERACGRLARRFRPPHRTRAVGGSGAGSGDLWRVGRFRPVDTDGCRPGLFSLHSHGALRGWVGQYGCSRSASAALDRRATAGALERTAGGRGGAHGADPRRPARPDGDPMGAARPRQRRYLDPAAQIFGD